MNIAAHERRLRRILGLSLYVLAAALGWFQIFHPGSDVLRLFFSLAFAILSTCWCTSDGRIRGRPVLNSFSWLIFFFWPLSVLSYLAWSRKWRGLGLALLHAAGLYGDCLISCQLAGCLRYGQAWFRRLF
jgi:hypothetical protein